MIGFQTRTFQNGQFKSSVSGEKELLVTYVEPLLSIKTAQLTTIGFALYRSRSTPSFIKRQNAGSVAFSDFLVASLRVQRFLELNSYV